MDSAMTLGEAKSIARHLGLTLRQVRSGDYGAAMDADLRAARAELARLRQLNPWQRSPTRRCHCSDADLQHDFHKIALELHRDRYDRALDEAIVQR
jgi:hypothetical protein